MEIKYVSDPKVTMRDSQGKRLASLLWGDTVRVVEITGKVAAHRALSWVGWLCSTELTWKPGIVGALYYRCRSG